MLDILAHSGRQIALPPSDLSDFDLGLEIARYGAEHIVFGYDHLLFLVGLTLLSTSLREIAWVIVLFAVSYSTTLVGGTLAGVAVSETLVDTIIAVSVGYVGAQLAFGDRTRWLGRDPRGPALAFGLAHGIGLSALVQELRLPGDDVLPSAIGFNVGVELGQIAVIALVLGALWTARAVPFPARERIPAGCALISASVALVALVFWQPSTALAHEARPPAAPVAPPPDADPIPEEDDGRYRSHVTRIEPRVPGLEARILGGDEQLEVTWTGRKPLVIIGAQGEPMLRLSDAGVEINELSPSAYLSSDRYAEVALPGDVDPQAPPRWKLIDSPGPIAWFEHRAHWMTAERPEIVGDGAEGTTIFHWRVPARLGDERIAIRGGLDWVPDPEALRDRVEVADGALASGIVLLVALAIGALIGVRLRGRLEPAA